MQLIDVIFKQCFLYTNREYYIMSFIYRDQCSQYVYKWYIYKFVYFLHTHTRLCLFLSVLKYFNLYHLLPTLSFYKITFFLFIKHNPLLQKCCLKYIFFTNKQMKPLLKMLNILKIRYLISLVTLLVVSVVLKMISFIRDSFEVYFFAFPPPPQIFTGYLFFF